MQLVIDFLSMEDLKKKLQNLLGGEAQKAVKVEETVKAEVEPVKVEEPVKAEVPFTEEVKPSTDVHPSEPAEEEAPAITYTLQDVQKAVRDLVKSKGKDAAKAILANYSATGASSVRAENYAAVIADLKEALNA